MRIATNIQSLVAQHSLKEHVENISNEGKKLSSGERIVSAADDPAGLAISEGLKSKLRSNYQSERNANDSISLIQIAEGSLNMMSNAGIRLRELAVQAATDTATDGDRFVINKEFQAMKNEIARLSENTSFNGGKLINNKDQGLEFQIGTGTDPKYDRIQYNLGKVIDTSHTLGMASIAVNSKDGAQNSLGHIDDMLSQINLARSELGSLGSRMNSVIQGLQISRENVSNANSKIRDADMALELSNKVKEELTQSANLEMLKVANNSPGAMLKLLS